MQYSLRLLNETSVAILLLVLGVIAGYIAIDSQVFPGGAPRWFGITALIVSALLIVAGVRMIRAAKRSSN